MGGPGPHRRKLGSAAGRRSGPGDHQRSDLAQSVQAGRQRLAAAPGSDAHRHRHAQFPSDLYILQGVVDLLGGRHQIVRIDSTDGDITPDLAALADAIDERHGSRDAFSRDLQERLPVRHARHHGARPSGRRAGALGPEPLRGRRAGRRWMHGTWTSPSAARTSTSTAARARRVSVCEPPPPGRGTIADLGLVGRRPAVHLRPGLPAGRRRAALPDRHRAHAVAAGARARACARRWRPAWTPSGRSRSGSRSTRLH